MHTQGVRRATASLRQHVRCTVPSAVKHASRRTLTTGDSPIPSTTWTHSRISTVFGLLMGVGIASTAYGVYQFYTTFNMWPPEVRADLRAGMKAKYQGDLDLSERYLRRAWQTAQSLPLASFASEPHLKLSGIAITLAETLESSNRSAEAYETYSVALVQLRASQATLSGRERMRSVALAHKLGEMAEVYQKGPEEAEHFLTFAVEEVLRVIQDEAKGGHPGKQKETAGKESEGETSVMLAELDLPQWVNKVDVAAPLEALGRFYAHEDKPEYAITLYMQVIGMLMQPAQGEVDASVEDRCRAAQVMNNLSEIVLRGPPPSNLPRAESWARQAQGIIDKTRILPGATAEGMALCEQTLAAVLFNLGVLLEMGGKNDGARKSFEQSLQQAQRIGMRSGAMEARSALRRLDRSVKSTASPSSAQKSP